MINVKVIAQTEELLDKEFDPEKFQTDMTIFAGKAAGICYMPDDYLSEGIQDISKAIKRAGLTSKSGHYSVYEHGHISYIIQCPKIMAMILNSTRLYSTSEKSSRYTKMNASTDIEDNMYSKWTSIFTNIIKVFNPNMKEANVTKLAMENARYMLSVFTNTTMMFTVPVNRAILLTQWLDKLAIDLKKYEYTPTSENYPDVITMVKMYNKFNIDLASCCEELSKELKSLLNQTNTPLLVDHKGMEIDFYNFTNVDDTRGEFLGDVYSVNYRASFAELAQAERHRTLAYKFTLPKYYDSDIESNIYVPNMIRNSHYQNEWISDMKQIMERGIMPQGYLIDINECGRFEDFALKCKERLCNRAQLEISEITVETVLKFFDNRDNLCKSNKDILMSMVNWKNDGYKVTVLPRCRFEGYKCMEPCEFAKYGLTNRIV